jgi:hypothetical protein
MVFESVAEFRPADTTALGTHLCPHSQPGNDTMAADSDDEAEEDPFAGLPGDIGDDREKFMRVTLASGEEVEHGEVYYRYSAEEFIVAPSMEFEDEETTRYRKGEVVRVEVHQHNPACFLTTAVAGEGETLETLREFRDETLRLTVPGRVLVGLYYLVSPPVARTLAAHPDSRTAAAVRWFVDRCAGLLDRRERSRRGQAPLSVLVVLLYVVGLVVATGGVALIRARAAIPDRKTAARSDAG